MEFFVLKSYDYSDISNIKGGSAIINDLKFEYQKGNHTGYIELGDIPFEYYYDCGDICVDITNIKFQSLEKLKTLFDWYDFYEELRKVCE